MVYLLITSHISMPGTRDHDARVHAPGVRVTVLPVLGAAPLPLVLLVAGVGGAQRRRAAAPDPAPLANKNILSPRSKTIFILDANNTHRGHGAALHGPHVLAGGDEEVLAAGVAEHLPPRGELARDCAEGAESAGLRRGGRARGGDGDGGAEEGGGGDGGLHAEVGVPPPLARVHELPALARHLPAQRPRVPEEPALLAENVAE